MQAINLLCMDWCFAVLILLDLGHHRVQNSESVSILHIVHIFQEVLFDELMKFSAKCNK